MARSWSASARRRCNLAAWPAAEAPAAAGGITLGVIKSLGPDTDGSVDALAARFKDLLAFRDKPLSVARMNLLRPAPSPEAVPQAARALRRRGLRRDRARQARPSLEERDDILAMLLRSRHDDGTPISDAEIRDHVITLLIQGHEPTAVASPGRSSVSRVTRRSSSGCGGRGRAGGVPRRRVQRGAAGSPARAADRADGGQALPARALRARPRHADRLQRLALHLREDSIPSRIGSAPSASSSRRRASTRGSRSAAGSGTASAEALRPTRRNTSSGPWSRGSASRPRLERDEGVHRRGIQWIPKEGCRLVLEERFASPVAA